MTAARIPPAELESLHVQGHLPKPFDLDTLTACVARFLPPG